MAVKCNICLIPDPEYAAGDVRVCQKCVEDSTRGQIIFETFDLYEELAEQDVRYLLTQLSIHSNLGERITQLPIPIDHAGLAPKAYNYLSDIVLEIGQRSNHLDYEAVLNAVDETYWNFAQVATHGTPRGIDTLTKREQAVYLHDRELLAGGFTTGGLRRLVTLACYRPYDSQFREKYGATIDQIIGLIDALADPNKRSVRSNHSPTATLKHLRSCEADC